MNFPLGKRSFACVSLDGLLFSHSQMLKVWDLEIVEKKKSVEIVEMSLEVIQCYPVRRLQTFDS